MAQDIVNTSQACMLRQRPYIGARSGREDRFSIRQPGERIARAFNRWPPEMVKEYI
jgi:hypothetical protein